MANKHPKMQELPAERLVTLHTDIRNGTKLTVVAKGLQADGYFKKSLPSTLARYLRRYKADVVDVETVNSLRDAGVEKVEEITSRFDPIKELADLTMTQIARANLLANQESASKIPMQARTREISLASKMLTDLVRMQMDAGIIPKQVQYEGFLLPGGLDPNDPQVVAFKITERTDNAIEYFEGVDYEEVSG